MKQTARNFWLDTCLFVFLLSSVFTGFVLWFFIPHQAAALFLGYNRPFWSTVHIFTGLAGLAGNVVHIIWHRAWLKALRKRPVASLPSKLRANRVTDRFAWVTFLSTTAFGVLDWIIPAYGNTVSIFGRLHVALAIAWLIGIIVHLVLHRRWIISTSRRKSVIPRMKPSIS